MSTSRDGLQILINVYYFVCVCVFVVIAITIKTFLYWFTAPQLAVSNSIHIQPNNNFFYVEKVGYIYIGGRRRQEGWMTIWQCRDGLVVYENYSLGTLEHNQLQGIYGCNIKT